MGVLPRSHTRPRKDEHLQCVNNIICVGLAALLVSIVANPYGRGWSSEGVRRSLEKGERPVLKVSKNKAKKGQRQLQSQVRVIEPLAVRKSSLVLHAHAGERAQTRAHCFREPKLCNAAILEHAVRPPHPAGGAKDPHVTARSRTSASAGVTGPRASHAHDRGPGETLRHAGRPPHPAGGASDPHVTAPSRTCPGHGTGPSHRSDSTCVGGCQCQACRKTAVARSTTWSQ